MESGSARNDPRPLTGEEETVKRNTDCVYFLASPLTCKKGSECEYRHSEGARVNPRDCKFWFSGNCLNPKCLFRHPPLDGLVGNPMTTSGPVMSSSSQGAIPMHLSTPNSSYNSNRNSVPCYYFQMGTCLKGDKCPFMHFPQPAANPVVKLIPKVSAPVSTQLDSRKMDAWKLKESSNEQNLSNAPNLAVKGAPSTAKVSDNSTSHLMNKRNLLPNPTGDGLPISQTTGVLVSTSTGFSQPHGLHVQSDKHHANDREAGEILEEPSAVGFPELNWSLKHQLRPSQYQSDQWAEEVFRDSSPGFDVLVDDVVNDGDYLHEKDGFICGSVQGARNLNHHLDHESAAMLDRDRRHGIVEGDRCRISSVSERFLDKAVLPLRRSGHRPRSPDGMDQSDLRHKLMKHRRLNGALFASSSDREGEPYSRHELKMQDRYSHNSYKDQRQVLPENKVSSRLRGRIRLPRASSPEFPADLQGGGWGRHRGKVLPARSSSLQGRLGERLRRKSIDDSNTRSLGSQQKGAHDVDPLGFAGPRSLAELRGAKADGNSRNTHSISSLEHDESKPLMAARLSESENSVSFDGPKPLSALQKAEPAPENAAISGDNGTTEAPGEVEACSFVPEADPAPLMLSQYVLETRLEDTKAVMEEDEVYIPSITADDVTEARVAAEVDEVDYTNQREGEYEYDTVEDSEYNKAEDDNMNPMNMDLDEDEDEDDFAKKIGLIFS